MCARFQGRRFDLYLTMVDYFYLFLNVRQAIYLLWGINFKQLSFCFFLTGSGSKLVQLLLLNNIYDVISFAAQVYLSNI